MCAAAPSRTIANGCGTRGSKRHPAWPGLSVLRKQSDERGEKRLHRSALDFVHAARKRPARQIEAPIAFRWQIDVFFARLRAAISRGRVQDLRKEAQNLRNQSKNRQKWFINYKVKDRWQGCEALARSATVVVSKIRPARIIGDSYLVSYCAPIARRAGLGRTC